MPRMADGRGMPTWARSAGLTNLVCRSWVNGSSLVVLCWPAGSSRPTSSPGGVAAAMPGCAARQRDPAAGARTAGVAPDDVADHDPPLSLHRLRACVAPGHRPAAKPRAKLSRRALRWAPEGHRVSALDRRAGRRGPRRAVEHRERRGAGRGQACVDRGPKWELALEMIDELSRWGRKCPVAVADAGYGDNALFRLELTRRSIPWVMAVKASTSAYPANAVPEPAERSSPRGRPSVPRYRQAPASLADLAVTAGRGQLRQVTWRHGTRRG
jgi:hypothetical protein